MIKIIDLHKQYKSKKGPDHRALNGINLELGSKGFVVLLGKSGSGKSTLLNILGGLDKFDSGEIIIKGKSTKDFKNNEWDSYRNTYVGFIFQEFYIIEEFTVGKNIALALELQGYEKEEIPKRVDEILSSVELDGYKDRKPNEISGGQKQRIAIARALVKDPKIILADEPTGNLDSETGKAILDTLKVLSKEKLVVLVTHDVDFANQYGDRIIELKDGGIISDTHKNTLSNYDNENDKSFYLKKSSLDFKSAFRLAISSIFTKKIRLIFTMFLFVTALMFVGFGTNFTNYDSAKSANLTFKKANTSEILLKKQLKDCETLLNREFCVIQDTSGNIEDINYLKNEYKDISFTETRQIYIGIERLNGSPGIDHDGDWYSHLMANITNLSVYEDIDDINYNIIEGTNISDINDILITDFVAEGLKYYKVYGEIDKDEDLIGKPFIDMGYEFKIAGIVETDYKKYDYIKEIKDRDLFYETVTSSGFKKEIDNNYERIITTRKNVNEMEKNINSMYVDLIYGNVNRVEVRSNLTKINSSYNLEDSILGEGSKLPENKNEILIPLTFLLDIINSENEFEISEDDVLDEDNNYLKNIINSKVNVHVSGFERRDTTKEFTVVGVYKNDENMDDNITFVSDEEFIEFYSNTPYIMVSAILGDNDNQNGQFISDLDDLHFKHDTIYSDVLNSLDIITTKAKVIFYWIAGIFAVFTTIMIFTFISSSITAKKRDIGTLRAIGARGIDVSKIFIIEGMLITLSAVLITIVLMILVINLINNQITKSFNIDLVLLYTDLLSILAVFGLGILVTLLASFIPVKRITVMKPIDAIKNK